MQPVTVIREAVNSGGSAMVATAIRQRNENEGTTTLSHPGQASDGGGAEPNAEAVAAQRLADAQQEYLMRREESEWQYKPRIAASAVNCGLFHLDAEEAP
jgi:hypothetical protein